jgi:hypothetical protein
MMINKKLSILAGAVLAASSAQAAFDPNSQVFIAVDNASSDTYVLDLGAAGSAINSPTTGLNFASFEWTVVGGSVGTAGNELAGPPGGNTGTYQGYSDEGIYSLGATDANKAGTIDTNGNVASKVAGYNSWLSTVSTAAGGASFVVIADGVAGDYTAGLQAEYNSGRMQSGTSTLGDQAYSLGYIGQVAGGNTETSAVTAASSLDFDGSTVSAVPVPAAAWLFGSALAGLTVIRRRK